MDPKEFYIDPDQSDYEYFGYDTETHNYDEDDAWDY